MKTFDNVLQLIGKTPLVRINKLVAPQSACLYAKLEYFNPGGSIKDRMAAHIVECAERRGDLKPGGTIVESTSGNTGLGLAIVGVVKGYRTIFTIPDKMSQEKINMLKAFGSEVIVTPTDVSHDSPEHYVEVAKRIARETKNAFHINQYDNLDNPEIHYRTTGPEIWEDTDGKVDCLVAAIGTGGTVSGTARYLKEKAKEQNRNVTVVCPDPIGSVFADLFYGREVKKPRTYKVEGIGQDAMVGALDMSVIDEIVNVSDKDSFLTARKMAREEGIFAGGSSGTIMFTALQVAKDLGPGKIVVAIVCDSGDRYISKQFNDEWMRDMGFLESFNNLASVKDVMLSSSSKIEYAGAEEAISSVVLRMSSLGISQMPIKPASGKVELMVREVDLLHALVNATARANDPVKSIGKPIRSKVFMGDTISVLNRVFETSDVAIVVDKADNVTGIVSKIDLVKFLTSRS
ncbi:MAG: pyridoxal-phosphate dependent enzyme [Deltaproteobacteria bacterium]|nr:pyridoxal-phosphate dependent enzyme [Deltaproteobacteria bacterium]